MVDDLFDLEDTHTHTRTTGEHFNGKDSCKFSLICLLQFQTSRALIPLSALTLLVGRQEGHTACKKLGVGLLVVTFDWKFARLIAPVVTTTSIILSSNKIQNGYFLVPANPGPPGKWPLKWREREFQTVREIFYIPTFHKIPWILVVGGDIF